jgi:hypothetical protein
MRFFVTGMIQQGDDTAFAEVANGDNITVHLDSPGGNLGASLRIGQLIRSKQYGTVVPAGARVRKRLRLRLSERRQTRTRRGRMAIGALRASAQ